MDKYIGQQKISEYNEIDLKVQYTLADSSGDTVTREQFDSMAKDEPYEDAMVRVEKWLPAVREIMEVLLNNDMRLLEKDFVLGRVDETIVQNYGKASAKFFGADFEHNISLSQIDKALKN